jgi:hypothetical protein
MASEEGFACMEGFLESVSNFMEASYKFTSKFVRLVLNRSAVLLLSSLPFYNLWDGWRCNRCEDNKQ